MYNVQLDPEELTKLIHRAFKEAITTHVQGGAEQRNYLTVAQAATYVKVSKSTVENWINDGDLKAKQFGRVKRILMTDLDKLMDGK